MKQYLPSFIGAAIVGLLLCKVNAPLRFVGMCVGGAIGAAVWTNKQKKSS